MTETTTARTPIGAEAAETLAVHLRAELPAHGHTYQCWTICASQGRPCLIRCSAIRAALKAANRLETP